MQRRDGNKQGFELLADAAWPYSVVAVKKNCHLTRRLEFRVIQLPPRYIRASSPRCGQSKTPSSSQKWERIHIEHVSTQLVHSLLRYNISRPFSKNQRNRSYSCHYATKTRNKNGYHREIIPREKQLGSRNIFLHTWNKIIKWDSLMSCSFKFSVSQNSGVEYLKIIIST